MERVQPEAGTPRRDRPRPRRRSLRRLALRWRRVRFRVDIYGAVALGTMLGGLARALTAMALDGRLVAAFPLGTWTANVVGSFIIGLYAALSGPDGRLLAGPRQRQFVMAGFCGGYTTFSVFSLESYRLMLVEDWGLAGLYIGLSLIGWLAAVWLGHMLGTRLNRLKGS